MIIEIVSELFQAMSISVTYSSGILLLTDFFIATHYPILLRSTFNPFRYFLYYCFGVLSYMQCFPNIRWVILQEEFRNHNFEWKITGASLFLVGMCFSSYIILPSEFLLIMFLEKNISFQEVMLRFLCGLPSTIITMATFETLFFHRYFRNLFLNRLPFN